MPIMIIKLTADTHFFSKNRLTEFFMLSTAQCANDYSDYQNDNKNVTRNARTNVATTVAKTAPMPLSTARA